MSLYYTVIIQIHFFIDSYILDFVSVSGEHCFNALKSLWIVSSEQLECVKHRSYSICNELHGWFELTFWESIAPVNECAIEDPMPNPNPCFMEEANDVEKGAGEGTEGGNNGGTDGGADEVAICPFGFSVTC